MYMTKKELKGVIKEIILSEVELAPRMISFKGLIFEGLKDSVYLELKSKAEVLNFIEQHYLKTYPAVVAANYGVMYKRPDGNVEMVGVIVYGQTTKPQDFEEIAVDDQGNSLLQKNEVFELLRLYLKPEAKQIPELSNLASYVIGLGNKKIKQDYSELKVIITRADSGQGHTGAIYQATNAIYLGKSEDRKRLWDKAQGKWIYRLKQLQKYGFETGKEAIEDAKINPNSPFEIKTATGKHMYIYILAGVGSSEGKRIMAGLIKDIQPYPKKPSSI